MTTAYCKRLIDVDLPIKRISAHARREKSIRHGHISTIHIWWARRPLAACRAVICASLWPDPADALCPPTFVAATRKVLRTRQRTLGGKAWNWDDPVQLREALLDFIADFADWDNSNNTEYVEAARSLTAAAHLALSNGRGSRPMVVDPFAGGGAIPLEALRVGADTFASDLNPIPVILNTVALSYIPKFGLQLADSIRVWGDWVTEKAKAELTPFYPRLADGCEPIGYLWCRTVTCEGPQCGAIVPLLRSLWLAKRSGNDAALCINVEPVGKNVTFDILSKPRPQDVGEGTSKRGAATCPVCGYTTPVTSVRDQLAARRGGSADAMLLAVRENDSRTGARIWRLPTAADREAADVSRHPTTPNEALPPAGTLGFRVQRYGMITWGDLFTPRQAHALSTLVRLIRETPIDGSPELVHGAPGRRRAGHAAGDRN